jgi:hypothetical protein
MSWWERQRELEEYDARFARDAEGQVIGGKPASTIDSWSDWPEDVQELLKEWNRQERLSFRGGAFAWNRIGFQARHRASVMGFDWSLAVFACTRCQAPCVTHSRGRAELDFEPFCDDCLIAYAREWQEVPHSAGRAFYELCGWLRLHPDHLAQLLGLNPKTPRRWRSGREPQAKDARRTFQFHSVMSVLVRRLGEAGARAWLTDARLALVARGELSELTTEAHPIIFPRDTKPRRASQLSDLEPGALWWGDYDPPDSTALTAPRPQVRRRARVRQRPPLSTPQSGTSTQRSTQ